MKTHLLLALTIVLSGCVAQPNVQPGTVNQISVYTDDPLEFGTVDVDPGVFPRLGTLSSYEGCVFSDTGPYHRIQTNLAKTGNVNAVEAVLTLPYIPSSAEVDPGGKSRYTPNVYTGGKVDGGAAVDAGFASDRNGNWTPYINVTVPPAAGMRTTFPTSLESGKTFAFRIKPGTSPTIKVWVSQDGVISVTIKGNWVKTQLYVNPPKIPEVVDLPIDTALTFTQKPGVVATGWKANGAGIVWKFMTSLAIQPASGNGGLVTGDYQFTGASWQNINLATANAAGSLSNRNLFTSSLAYRNTENCVKPSGVITATGPSNLPNITASILLRVLGKYGRTPADPIALIGSPAEVVTKKIRVTNSGTNGKSGGLSYVTVNFTPPGGTALGAKQIASGKFLDIPFSYTCDTLGPVNKEFRVRYSENETATSTDQGDPIVTPFEAGTIKYVPVKDVVKVTLTCLKDLDYTKPSYSGATEVAVGTNAPGTITFKNNAGKLTYTAVSSDPALFALTTGSGSALNAETATIATTIKCPATAQQKDVTVTITITNGTVTKTETVTIPVNCKKPLKSGIKVTPSGALTFSMPVGSSQTQNVVIENIGDVGSSLEYIRYGASNGQIILGSAPTGTATTQAVSAGTYPGAPPALNWANGTINPATALEGTLVNTGTSASTTIPVTVNCTRLETGFSPILNIVYQKPELDALGKPLLGQITVSLAITCTPAPSASITASVVTPYDGPTQLCPRVSGSFTFDFTGVVGTINLGLKINGSDIGFTTLTQTSANSFSYTTIHSCNYDVADHSLQVYASDAQGAIIVTSAPAVFRVTDNRWTGWLSNSTNNCAGVAGLPLDLSLAAPGETLQSATGVAAGGALKLLMKPGVTYTFQGLNSSQGFNQSFAGGFPLPFDGDPDTRDGRTGFLFAGFTRVCPTAAAPGVAAQALTNELTSFTSLVPVVAPRKIQVPFTR